MQPNNVYYGGGVQPQLGTSRPSSRRKLFIVGGVVLVLLTIALGVVAAFSSTKSGGSGKSDQMLTLIAAGDGVKSYDLLSVNGQASISRENWVSQVVAMRPILADKKLEKIYSQEIEGGHTETAYNVGEKGSIYRITLVHETSTGKIETVTYNKTSL